MIDRHKMKRFFVYIYIQLIGWGALYGAGFSASAPREVGVEDVFNLTYTISDTDFDKLETPNWDNDFKTMSGPMESTSSSYRFENGKMSKSSQRSVTYVLKPRKKGKFTIGKAAIVSNGKKTASNSLSITVVDGSLQPSQQSGGGGGFFADPFEEFLEPMWSRRQRNMPKFQEDDAFLKLEVSQKEVFEQQIFVATVMLYTQYGMTIRQLDEPDREDFISEYVKTDLNRDKKKVTINGKEYWQCPVLCYALSPVKTGSLKIGSCEIAADFNLDGYNSVLKTLKASPVVIKVKALPDKPQKYVGGVGDFDVTTQMVPDGGYRAGDAVTFRIKFEGNGNLKAIQAPVLNFPENFEQYGVKPVTDVKYNTEGMTGSKTFDYVMVPRKDGDYVLPADTICFFDTKSGHYKNIKIKPLEMKVAKGLPVAQGVKNGGSETKSAENSDINYIKTKEPSLSADKSFLLGSVWYYLILFLLTVLLVGVIVWMRIKYGKMADEDYLKNKNANKMAEKRLHAASELMKEKDESKFYQEVNNALIYYLKDKFGLKESDLSKDKIENILCNNGISPEVVDSYLSVYDECLSANYFSVKPSMEKVYNEAVDVLGKVEEQLKKKK